MNEDRLNKIGAMCAAPAIPSRYAEELVAEVRRLRAGITALADEYACHAEVPVPLRIIVQDLRTALGDA